MSHSYECRSGPYRQYVLCQGRPIGALSQNRIRHYIFPLLTPAGVSVLQECPPDHMHHQGIMVGQDLVNGHNFWAMRFPNMLINIQASPGPQPAAPKVDDRGVHFDLDLCWRTADQQSILQESRRVRFWATEDIHFVEVTTQWNASFGDLFLGQTKEGGVGMRVNPALEASWGGQVRASTGLTGTAAIHETHAQWLEVYGQVGPCPAGVVMMPHPSQEPLPWFTRDYGLHLLGATRRQARQIKAGQSMTMRVGFAAYDGVSDGSMAAKAWDIYRQQQDGS